MDLFRLFRWLIGRLWHRGRLRMAAALCKENITEHDSKEQFQQACRRFFSFLEEQCDFQRDPPRLHEPGFQNPYIVIYRNRSLILVIEGLSHGARTRMCLIDRDGQLLDIAGLVKRRNPKLLYLCSLASGQYEQIPLYAEALWGCAADVLDGDLKGVSRCEAFNSEFSFGVFSDADDMDYFLKCHAPRPGSALMQV